MLFCNVIIVSVLALLFVVVPVSGLLYNKDQNHLLPKLAVFQSYRIFIQVYFQNNCYCTVLHISDSPAYELFTNIVENRNRIKDS